MCVDTLYLAYQGQVQNKKQRDTAAQDAEMRLKKEAAAKADSDKENEAAGNPDILGEQEDQDVIF
jgi:V-type H+-transporting ATPase subunit D